MHIWIVDHNGNTLCHVDSDCARQVLALRCSVALTLDAATVQAHVFCRLTGLYSGPVLNWANEVYALIKERSAHPNGVGSAYYHQAFDSVQQQIHSIEGGRLPDTTVATEAGQSNFVTELLARLAVYNQQVSGNTVPGISSGDVHQLTDAHVREGVAAILRQALARECTFDASAIATPPPDSVGSCALDDAVGLAVAFTTGADPRPEARYPDTMTRLWAAFRASLPRAVFCIDDARPWDVPEVWLAPARDLFLAALGPIQRSYHHYFVLAVHTLKYLNILYAASSPVELDPYIELNSTTGSFWCGVLGEGGSTTTLTNHNVDAIWIRDQRGAIVYFANLTGSSGPPRVDFNLNVLSYPATSLTPYQFSPGRGVWSGRDPLAPPTVFFQRFTTGLVGPTGGPMPWGRYFSGRTPRMYEPFLTFHRDGSCVVGVRGENGIRSVGTSQLQPRIVKIYILDQDGNVVCESFSIGSSGIQTMQCGIPSTAVTIQ